MNMAYWVIFFIEHGGFCVEIVYVQTEMVEYNSLP